MVDRGLAGLWFFGAILGAMVGMLALLGVERRVVAIAAVASALFFGLLLATYRSFRGIAEEARRQAPRSTDLPPRPPSSQPPAPNTAPTTLPP